MADKNEILNIYTDGACKGNPGIGGWGAILEYGNTKKEIKHTAKGQTNLFPFSERPAAKIINAASPAIIPISPKIMPLLSNEFDLLYEPKTVIFPIN